MRSLVIMKKFFASLSFLVFTSLGLGAGEPQHLAAVQFTDVKVEPESFWGRRLEASRKVTVPLSFSKCEESGRYRNFRQAALQMASPGKNLGFPPSGFSFDDTDVYKTIEGASYQLQNNPDPAMEAYIDSILVIVAAAQEPDGYLYTPRTMNPEHPHAWAGDRRWVKEEDLSHELYNLGHMIEAAVAHYQATGKRKFLDIAIRYADCAIREVGPGEGQVRVVPGHQIAEMALVRLYNVTGERRYLDFAKYLLDYRGKTAIKQEYSQSHKPVLEQDEAVGHAVRAAYMYAGMADVAAATGDSAYIRAIDRIWEDIVTRKMYITGGIGSTSDGEAFGKAWELPNLTSYCETCAAIGNVYVAQRMFLLHGGAKYVDVLERTLYNGLISGESLAGDAFFYPNPLESDGTHERKPWFGCACCPSNISRFIPSMPGYVYASKGNSLYVNLFVPGSMAASVGGRKVSLTQKTEYPWNGDVSIVIDSLGGRPDMEIKVRIPGWVRGEVTPGGLYKYADNVSMSYTISVGGIPINACAGEDGYVSISREWTAGDRIEVHFDMRPRLVAADGRVKADRGRLAVQMGPIVYCAEQPDNAGIPVRSAVLDRKAAVDFEFRPGFLGGINVLKASLKGGGKLTLIPYYSWCNRGPSEMAVWLRAR